MMILDEIQELYAVKGLLQWQTINQKRVLFSHLELVTLLFGPVYILNVLNHASLNSNQEKRVTP